LFSTRNYWFALLALYQQASKARARTHLCSSLIGNKEKEINIHEQLGINVILGAGGAAETKQKGKPLFADLAHIARVFC